MLDGRSPTGAGHRVRRAALAPVDIASLAAFRINWGAAESGGDILIAGWRGTSGAAQSATLNDDSYLIVFPVQ